MQKYINLVKNFMVDGKLVSAKPNGNGHINDTLLVEMKTDDIKTSRYILQAINSNVFPNIDGLMYNIISVSQYLKKGVTDNRGAMDFVPTLDGKYYFFDENGVPWRMYHFIEDAVSLELPENTKDFYECGFGFGNFQRQLANFPAHELFETIANFHNTPKRYENFKKAVEKDICRRAACVKAEIDFVKSEEDFYPVLTQNNEKGLLPLRVTHNDTKINNVLLDGETRKAVCVIDLDTVMPGLSVNDFGDAIRIGANTAAEDEKDLSKVFLDLDLFEAFTKGFIEGSGGILTEDEIMLLPEGAKMMTIECGMRFLTDYLEGDTYFRTSYTEHNLDRCRTQFELVKDMNRKWEQMKNIVKKYI